MLLSGQCREPFLQIYRQRLTLTMPHRFHQQLELVLRMAPGSNMHASDQAGARHGSPGRRDLQHSSETPIHILDDRATGLNDEPSQPRTTSRLRTGPCARGENLSFCHCYFGYIYAYHLRHLSAVCWLQGRSPAWQQPPGTRLNKHQGCRCRTGIPQSQCPVSPSFQSAE